MEVQYIIVIIMVGMLLMQFTTTKILNILNIKKEILDNTLISIVCSLSGVIEVQTITCDISIQGKICLRRV